MMAGIEVLGKGADPTLSTMERTSSEETGDVSWRARAKSVWRLRFGDIIGSADCEHVELVEAEALLAEGLRLTSWPMN
ncbi:MAG TPA: hypothetical protein VK147_06295, partial [Candidatus Didemnitutus sp.]|nr:hypothetical protein [Candidatus Didemnitutus sp.]